MSLVRSAVRLDSAWAALLDCGHSVKAEGKQRKGDFFECRACEAENKEALPDRSEEIDST